ncbi:uncharacterized protein J4E79_003304 [Alternaria viburni]|uniref:uncharacterized protein n=1 Tax=Alternaria viburni TaxID=566460 RepID=UPI0020C482DD|nr:uncharacterized protein J4E79_003304 [Alternaria viburni]KAI4665005.1 hypothetical protein J4E79_003304 [Alternaria viburni]
MSPSIELTTTPRPNPSVTSKSTPKAHLILIVTSLYLGTFLVALDTIILNPILLTITKTFHVLDHLAWYGTYIGETV